MTTSYQVQTHCLEISDLLVKIARENGWSNVPESGHQWPWLLLCPDGRRGDWSNCGLQLHQTVSIREFIDLLKKPAIPKEPLIMIGEHEVEFRTNGILLLSCRFIDTATIDEIHARLHADD